MDMKLITQAHRFLLRSCSFTLASRVNKDNFWLGFFKDSGHLLVPQAGCAADFMNFLLGSAACCKCIQCVDIMP